MNANRFFPHQLSLAALTLCLLSAPSLRAQTPSGPTFSTQSSPNLEVSVFPLGNRTSAIRVIYNNHTGRIVEVFIKDQKGKIWYQESDYFQFYRRNFDLSLLPEGQYTVDLVTKNEHVARSFTIDSPASVKSRIAMNNLPGLPETPVATKLIVSQ